MPDENACIACGAIVVIGQPTDKGWLCQECSAALAAKRRQPTETELEWLRLSAKKEKPDAR